jgi:hypothetical protein
MEQTSRTLVDGKEIVVRGRLPRIAQLRSEYYESVSDPSRFLDELKGAPIKADLFTFIDASRSRAFPEFHQEYDSIAALSITTHEHWWKKQINDKTRNMVRKAYKSGVEIRVARFTDEFVRGVVTLYNEGQGVQAFRQGF